MKKLYILLFILSATTCLYSQSAIQPIELSDSRFRFIYKNTGQKVNDLVWDETESFVNGFAKVASGNKWGFVNRFGNPVIKAEYESVRNFVNKLAAVKKNSRWGFIDETGMTIIDFEYDIVYDFKENVTAVIKTTNGF